jgi:hypothetical protein
MYSPAKFVCRSFFYALVLLFTSNACTNPDQKRISDFINSPTGQTILHVAAKAGQSAVEQYASSGNVGGKEVAQDALDGASAELRKAQTPGVALSASAAHEAAKDAVNEGTGAPAVSRKVAPAVARAVADAVKREKAPADLALEAAARGLDLAAARQ